ncbi:phosphate ABC transporter permease subunit PstC [Acidisphaera rubrifaciens]|uniref:Phosphate transport system permease protein n=1 Tax=Acidisphaera rubrifaciens HS-AP3 TaxID=1231350 RepID=A0A0D6PB96_9PROT|nr:phosphate ABC transporter permease subunit PstC [Acidisphaera rubrifaciens]GAN78124.1 ABC transporter phosphate permease PstC [Acidisphaera rubrifaciens HS-AP3]
MSPSTDFAGAAGMTTPTRRHKKPDWLASKIFTVALYGSCVVFLLLIAGLVEELVRGSMLSLRTFGLGFLWSSEWNPVTSQFGALPFIYGTVVSSAVALLLAAFSGVLAGIYLAEFAPRRVATGLALLIELLAAVPSVVYGLWGLFVLAPFVTNWLGPLLQATLGFLPIFQGNIFGVNMLLAGLILALMIVPTIVVVTRDLILAMPMRYREASIALGATRWEAVSKVILPALRPGIFGACMLALGRALGETIATTMVIGNRPAISVSLFAPGYTMASVIANEFTEATTNIYLSALVELGLLLLVISVIVNGAGRLLLRLLQRSA